MTFASTSAFQGSSRDFFHGDENYLEVDTSNTMPHLNCIVPWVNSMHVWDHTSLNYLLAVTEPSLGILYVVIYQSLDNMICICENLRQIVALVAKIIFQPWNSFPKFGVNFSFGSELKTQPTWRQDGSQEQICKAKKFYTLDNTTTTLLSCILEFLKFALTNAQLQKTSNLKIQRKLSQALKSLQKYKFYYNLQVVNLLNATLQQLDLKVYGGDQLTW